MVEILEEKINNFVSIAKFLSQEDYIKKGEGHNNNIYHIFAERYLEKPSIPEGVFAALSATICTVKGIPVIDDPDWY